ncbi:hypothetical protein GJV85_07185 [Sulfurimonas aquatica]|uniref:Periplasmic protein n=1 Tax=Sulfurimonas aquatica TaxID=2672570 RepID=A0A975B0C5_9BACT|nr:hypothetical protein [Sulfurimonas aquatica]QSZ41896.1 hypothetical protein GJV85_07185 [Sulfurimonas aquatica]
MKKLLFLLLPVFMFAQSFMLSNIPLPKTYIQNLDPYECDQLCLQDFLDNDMIFSFLAHAKEKLQDEKQNETRVMLVSILNLGSFRTGKTFKVAILLPYKKIGKYASSTTNATFAYLITKSHPFMLKSYKIESEESLDIQKALEQIQADGFEYIIAPLTMQGAENIAEIDPQINIYFPTINKNDMNTSSPFLSFGAIDYMAQSKALLKESVSPLVIFSDKSSVGKKLSTYQYKQFFTEDEVDLNDTDQSLYIDVTEDENLEEEIEKKAIQYYISKRTTNIESHLKENEKIVNGSFFINTPIIKTGMIMSQLTLYDVNATNVLSTQINYDPLLLSMTQYNDRKNMIVANSITEHNNVLIETNSLLGNNIVYDWINYSTTVGIDYFYSLSTNEQRAYSIRVEDNQMQYTTELLKPKASKFVKYSQ